MWSLVKKINIQNYESYVIEFAFDPENVDFIQDVMMHAYT